MQKKISTLLLAFPLCQASITSLASDPGPTIQDTIQMGTVTVAGDTAPSTAEITGAGDLAVTLSFCAYSNVFETPGTSKNPGIDFNLSSAKQTSTAESNFVMTHDASTDNEIIPYTVQFTSGLKTTPSFSANASGDTGNVLLNPAPLDSCTSGSGTTVVATVTIPAAVKFGMPSGAYSDTLTITASAPTYP